MRVLSLFDGIACGYEALLRAGIKVDAYYASEIDKYAIQVALKNHPDIIEIGDVNNINFEEYKDIDLLIGGSPCQDLSQANTKWKWLEWLKSGLFYKYLEALRVIKPKYFLLENVRMSKKNQDIITELVWVPPIEINSLLVSAQNRRRLYWTNIPWVMQPEDKWIRVKDIIEHEVDEKYFLSPAMLDYMNWVNQKPSKFPRKQRFDQSLKNVNEKWIANCVSTNAWNRPVDNFIIEKDGRIRKFTPIECERLQTLPDNYTECVSNTQRYKALWNWWTVDVVSHIFKRLK